MQKKPPHVAMTFTAYTDGRTVVKLACGRCPWTSELADPTDRLTSTLLPRAAKQATEHAAECPGG